MPDEVYDVRVRERRTASLDVLLHDFQGVRVTREDMVLFSQFNRNEFEFEPFGYRPAVPISTECSSFTNVNPAPPWVDRLKHIRSLTLFQAAWREAMPPARVPSPIPMPDTGQDPTDAPPNSPDGGAGPGDMTTTRLSHPGGVPVTDLIPRTGRFHSFLPKEERTVMRVGVLRLAPDLVLMLYGEFRGPKLVQVRVRYLRTDDSGGVRTDVLLRPTFNPPR
jgi:hypothetical protein